MKMYAVRRTKVNQCDDVLKEHESAVHVTRGGRPIIGLEPERIKTINVEEQVMEWRDAGHIHAWFVKNVQNGKAYAESYLVTRDKLIELLTVCEKVLAASHLVPARMFASSLSKWESPDPEAMRENAKVINNVNVAHKLLPVTGMRSDADYDEAYLKVVEETRSWILRMFADRPDRLSEVYYSTSRW
jgi:hypothetical protein